MRIIDLERAIREAKQVVKGAAGKQLADLNRSVTTAQKRLDNKIEAISRLGSEKEGDLIATYSKLKLKINLEDVAKKVVGQLKNQLEIVSQSKTEQDNEIKTAMEMARQKCAALTELVENINSEEQFEHVLQHAVSTEAQLEANA